MNSEFEWDPEKAVGNLDKHGVTFEEAASVFFDPLSITINDPKHSVEERRVYHHRSLDPAENTSCRSHWPR